MTTRHPELRWMACSLVLLLLGSCAHSESSSSEESIEAALPAREFRAAWVATVANIDWPTKPGLSVSDQQREAIAILDRLVELNFNAVIFQVRPHGDALYDSPLEPWSTYLSGVQGQAPTPYYDPLAFWVEAAHDRGLALHAWFNPYRAHHPAQKSPMSADSVVKQHPSWVYKLGDKGYWWMDPANPEVQDHCVDVVMDVVNRYDIDGVHFDDYFYPYPSYNGDKDFPDEQNYARYIAAGGALAQDDWRRAAVDRLVERLSIEIPEAKDHVLFGLSPFGIWRPGYPEGIAGMDQYATLYADAKRWLNEGWVDYFMPQLYWPISQLPQSFPLLLRWWHDENTQGRHVWPGTSVARAKGEKGAIEVTNQVMITRALAPESPGLCMFSMKWLMSDDSHVVKALVKGPYAKPALIPATPWRGPKPPLPIASVYGTPGNKLLVRWEQIPQSNVILYLIAVESNGQWHHHFVPKGGPPEIMLKETDPSQILIFAIDRAGNASEAVAPSRGLARALSAP